MYAKIFTDVVDIFFTLYGLKFQALLHPCPHLLMELYKCLFKGSD